MAQITPSQGMCSQNKKGARIMEIPVLQGKNTKPIKGINMVGMTTLIKKEVGRFMVVYLQTILAPVITTLLFYAVFMLAFGGITKEVSGIPFLQFLAPGLIMMAMAQNAFANTSSSLIIAKIQGNIVDVLMPPLSHMELFTGYVIGGVLRGLAVGLTAILALAIFVPQDIHSIASIVGFGILGSYFMASMGVLAGIWAEKFDHIAAFTNFFVTPLTFLSGTFYSIHSLPDIWEGVAIFNPFFYMIDGFRSGFIGVNEGGLVTGAVLLIVCNIALTLIAYAMLRTGYKIKS